MSDVERKSLLDRVFAATNTDDSRRLYDEWAATYNSDMVKHEFTAPRLIAEAVVRGLDRSDNVAQEQALEGMTIVDAGCGTGLVGIELTKFGAKNIVGLDISEGMLGVARNTNAYARLEITDLTKKLPHDSGAYDALTCCGMFTHGHLDCEPLDEFIRIVKIGGVLAATVLDSHWDEKGFAEYVQNCASQGVVEIIEKDSHKYRKDTGGGRVLLLKKLKNA